MSDGMSGTGIIFKSQDFTTHPAEQHTVHILDNANNSRTQPERPSSAEHSSSASASTEYDVETKLLKYHDQIRKKVSPAGCDAESHHREMAKAGYIVSKIRFPGAGPTMWATTAGPH